jgi:hypothetical protein
MQALIQYKRHGSAALIGVAVLHLAADTNFAGFVKCVKELASSGLFDIQTDAEGEEIVFRSAFVRWALGQELDENRYDSPVRDDVELELVLKMMGKRGWMDHFVVFYDVVVGRRRNTADIVVTNTDGAGTPRTACGEGGLWPDL